MAMRLTREHFRFLSGYVQGLDSRALWDRYLYANGPSDLRRIRAITALLLDELGALARQAGRPGTGALLRRRSEPATAAPTPTLEAFSATLPNDMHSEAELIELWKEAHADLSGNHRPAQRRQRLIARQLDALRWLESLAVAAPRPEDKVSVWLEPAVSRRLGAVGLATLGDLRRWIDRHGHHWHRPIPRVGARGAARIMRWLAAHADALGTPPAHALKPRSQIDVNSLAPAPATGVVPLERLRLPGALSGEQGSNRAEANRRKIAAADDLEAVNAWLLQHPPRSHTWRAYRREAERFLLWSVFERNKALSSLTAADCAAFRAFLATPGAGWVSPRHVPRWSERWRPLEAGLSPASVATAVSIVKNLCGWLVRQSYLEANPWDDAPATRRVEQPASPSRTLRESDWALLQRWLADQQPSPSTRRLRALITLGVHTGLRESELAAARTGWLRRTSAADGTRAWSMAVAAGPGHAAPRTVDLPQEATDPLLAYLSEATPPEPAACCEVDRPLFAHRSEPGRALTPGRVYSLVKSAFHRCAETIEAIDPVAAERLRRASVHWLRHTHARQLLASGTPPGVMQHRLGHLSPASTAAYLGSSRTDDDAADASH